MKCHGCGTTDGDIKRCSRCKTVFYCSKDCQKRDWKRHKSQCWRQAQINERYLEAESTLDSQGIKIIELDKVPDETEAFRGMPFYAARQPVHALLATVEEIGLHFLPNRHGTRIKDRSGRETVVYFHIARDFPYPFFSWMDLIPGNVICIYDAHMHTFFDGQYGMRIDHARDIRIFK